MMILLVASGVLRAADGATVTASDAAGAIRALAEAKPGATILLAPGSYGTIRASGVRGAEKQPVTLRAADPKQPPVFEKVPVGMHLSKCAYLVLRDLVVRGAANNGVNIDDGGDAENPSHHVVLENVRVSEVGPRGNRDALKLSGVTDLVVRNCAFEGWGGSAIDMVGCHRVLVEASTFRGKEGFSQSNGVQAKGGSSAVTVRNCFFVDGGGRAVNLGGSTGKAYFRPPGATCEAKDITVEGCRFTGSDVPVSFVGVDGAVVRYNTVYRPKRWVVRILQENTGEGMVPSRNGRFEHNVVVYNAASVRSPVSSGGGTQPETFTFTSNLWYAEDAPGRSRPQLPAPETGGVYGTDPKVKPQSDGELSTPRTGPTAKIGAGALPATAK
jgi:Right handed beta helix region